MTLETLRMEGITKRFPGVTALDSAHFETTGGEIHALLGANGAGKSTLMKILAGAYTADGGVITIGGEKVSIQAPYDAKRIGIQCVYQEVDTALVPELTAAENILLDRFASSDDLRFIHWNKHIRELERMLADMDIRLPLRKHVSSLTLAEKQMVLIARAVLQKAKFVIFDEPTAPLSVDEANRLFAIMRKLKKDGVGCIFISHRLPEVFDICDRLTVMRDGRRVFTAGTEETTIVAVIEHMLGKPFAEEYPKTETKRGDRMLEVQDIRSGTKVRGVSMDVHRGEIVGVVGLVGAGKTELSRVLFGADMKDGGQIMMRGKNITLRHPKEAIDAGIVLVPEERRKEGILVDESVGTNLALPTLRRYSLAGWVRKLPIRRMAERIVTGLGVKTPHIGQKVGLLSGGNQQKVAVGKWIPTGADVYLFDEPTKGVDVGAKSDIFRMIGSLAQEGKGIVYFSSEIAEILGIADRILVMCDGRIVKQFNRGEATDKDILFYASGGKEAVYA